MNLALQQSTDDGVVQRRRARPTASRCGRCGRCGGARASCFGHPALKKQAYRLFRRMPVQRGPDGLRVAHGPAVLRQPALHLRGGGRDRAGQAGASSRSGRTPSGRRRASRPAPGSVMRESWRYYYAMARAQFWVDNQGFPRHFTRRPGDDVHPDLARHAAQADGLRRAGAGAGQRRDAARAQGDDAALERAAGAERVLRRDVREVLRLRGKARPPGAAAQRPSRARRRRGVGAREEARAEPADRPAAGALRADLPRPGPPAGARVRRAVRPRRHGARARWRRRS